MFGDLGAAYAAVQRPSRDAYRSKPLWYFYATVRVGGGVVNSDAVKLIKALAS